MKRRYSRFPPDPAAREKRIIQELDELEQGGVRMKMDHPPSSEG